MPLYEILCISAHAAKYVSFFLLSIDSQLTENDSPGRNPWPRETDRFNGHEQRRRCSLD